GGPRRDGKKLAARSGAHRGADRGPRRSFAVYRSGRTHPGQTRFPPQDGGPQGGSRGVLSADGGPAEVSGPPTLSGPRVGIRTGSCARGVGQSADRTGSTDRGPSRGGGVVRGPPEAATAWPALPRQVRAPPQSVQGAGEYLHTPARLQPGQGGREAGQ